MDNSAAKASLEKMRKDLLARVSRIETDANRMATGVANPADRAAVVAYLKTLK